MVRNQLLLGPVIQTPATTEEHVRSVKLIEAIRSLVTCASVLQASAEFTASTISMNVKGILVRMGGYALIKLLTILVNAQGSTWEGIANTNVLVHWAWRVE